GRRRSMRVRAGRGVVWRGSWCPAVPRIRSRAMVRSRERPTMGSLYRIGRPSAPSAEPAFRAGAGPATVIPIVPGGLPMLGVKLDVGPFLARVGQELMRID